MFTLFVYTAGYGLLPSTLMALLFWVFTGLVIWGFVDVVVTPARQFEFARQSLAAWILGHIFFGPLATAGWLAVRRRVKQAQPPQNHHPPLPWQNSPAYPVPPEPPFIPAHFDPPEPNTERRPPLR